MDYTVVAEVMGAAVALFISGGVLGAWLRKPVRADMRVVREINFAPRPQVEALTVMETAVAAGSSPFITCVFENAAGGVVARKRLRRESVTDPILWAGRNYKQTAGNSDCQYFRQVA